MILMEHPQPESVSSVRLTHKTLGGYIYYVKYNIPDSKVHGANMGPICGRQDPGGPHVGPMNLAIWDTVYYRLI